MGENGPFVRGGATLPPQMASARRDKVSAGRCGLVAYHTGQHRRSDERIGLVPVGPPPHQAACALREVVPYPVPHRGIFGGLHARTHPTT